MGWVLEQVSEQRPQACVLLSLELEPELERRQQPDDVPAVVSLLVAWLRLLELLSGVACGMVPESPSCPDHCLKYATLQ